MPSVEDVLGDLWLWGNAIDDDVLGQLAASQAAREHASGQFQHLVDMLADIDAHGGLDAIFGGALEDLLLEPALQALTSALSENRTWAPAAWGGNAAGNVTTSSSSMRQTTGEDGKVRYTLETCKNQKCESTSGVVDPAGPAQSDAKDAGAGRGIIEFLTQDVPLVKTEYTQDELTHFS